MIDTNTKKYLVVFVITAAIFGTALFINNRLTDKRIAEVQAIENKIAIDILSSETQFNLLAESSCIDVGSAPVLSTELNELAGELSFTESRLGSESQVVIDLKKYYTLLQIKDFILMKRITEKCGIKPIVILYFYSNKGDCEDCKKVGYVLDYLRTEYPSIRVYAFDYNLDISAIQTLVSIYKVKNELPALVINDKAYYKITNLEDLEKALPEIKILKAEQEKAEAILKTSTTTER